MESSTADFFWDYNKILVASTKKESTEEESAEKERDEEETLHHVLCLLG